MVSALAIFCEDIREEKSGQDILIGIMPDNVNIPTTLSPPALPKFAIYLRINIPIDYQPKSMSASLRNTSDVVVFENAWDLSVIEKAFSDARATQMPIVGFLMKASTGNFGIEKPGKITVVVTVDGEDSFAGVLNVIFLPATAS